MIVVRIDRLKALRVMLDDGRVCRWKLGGGRKVGNLHRYSMLRKILLKVDIFPHFERVFKLSIPMFPKAASLLQSIIFHNLEPRHAKD